MTIGIGKRFIIGPDYFIMIKGVSFFCGDIKIKSSFNANMEEPIYILGYNHDKMLMLDFSAQPNDAVFSVRSQRSLFRNMSWS